MAKAKKEIKLNPDYDNTFDEMLLDQQQERKKAGIVNIPIEKLHSFENHPFKVEDNEKMDELVANTVDASAEKHVPVVTKVDDCTIKVEVGSAPHPMTPEHHISFIYVETENGGMRITVKDKEKAEAVFCTCADKPVAVYEYCNLHGLWKTEL